MSERKRATVESHADRARADGRLQDHVLWHWLSCLWPHIFTAIA